MRSTYVIAGTVPGSGLLPQRDRRAARIAHDREVARGTLGPRLEELGAELLRLRGRGVDIVDLDVRDPATDLAVLRGHAGERALLAREHRHPGRAVGGRPAQELLVERHGLLGLVAAVVKPHECVRHGVSFRGGDVRAGSDPTGHLSESGILRRLGSEMPTKTEDLFWRLAAKLASEDPRVVEGT